MYLNHVNFSLEHVVELNYGLHEFSNKTVTVLQETVPGVVEDPSIFLHPQKISEINPELVAIIKNQPTYGPVSVHTMVRDNNETIWVAINTAKLDYTVAWLTKTPDRSGCGFSLPATAGPRGLEAETMQNNVKVLEPKTSVRLQFAFGLDNTVGSKSLHTAITMLGGIV